MGGSKALKRQRWKRREKHREKAMNDHRRHEDKRSIYFMAIEMKNKKGKNTNNSSHFGRTAHDALYSHTTFSYWIIHNHTQSNNVFVSHLIKLYFLIHCSPCFVSHLSLVCPSHSILYYFSFDLHANAFYFTNSRHFISSFRFHTRTHAHTHIHTFSLCN